MPRIWRYHGCPHRQVNRYRSQRTPSATWTGYYGGARRGLRGSTRRQSLHVSNSLRHTPMNRRRYHAPWTTNFGAIMGSKRPSRLCYATSGRGQGRQLARCGSRSTCRGARGRATRGKGLRSFSGSLVLLHARVLYHGHCRNGYSQVRQRLSGNFRLAAYDMYHGHVYARPIRHALGCRRSSTHGKILGQGQRPCPRVVHWGDG